MKRGAVFAIVLGMALAALYFSERRRDKSPVSPNAVLQMAADVQRDVTRAPMRFTRLSDDEEIRIGKELAERYSTSGTNLGPKSRAWKNTSPRLAGPFLPTRIDACRTSFTWCPTAR